MVKRLAATILFSVSSLTLAQTPVDYANLREDVQGLAQKVGDLTLRVEQLEHENAQLRAKTGAPQDVVTTAQLNAAVAALNAAIQAANASSKHEILEQVGTQMEKLARQTNAALDAVSAAAKPAAVSAPRATEVTPGPNSSATAAATKDGLYYTVQKGDTLALICKKTGGKFQEVIDANKLTDPSKIRVGQILFIPGGK